MDAYVQKPLTEYEKKYLEDLFYRYREDIQEKIQKKMADEFHLLSRYKGDLARGYVALNGHHGTMVGIMKEIIDKQDQLFALFRDVTRLITGKFPDLMGEVDV